MPDAENDPGVLAPRCPRCGWQASDREDTPENYEAARADVVEHKAACPSPPKCRACAEGVPAEIAPCTCPIPPGGPDA